MNVHGVGICKYGDVPSGSLFLLNESLCVKSEYGNKSYIVGSGCILSIKDDENPTVMILEIAESYLIERINHYKNNERYIIGFTKEQLSFIIETMVKYANIFIKEK